MSWFKATKPRIVYLKLVECTKEINTYQATFTLEFGQGCVTETITLEDQYDVSDRGIFYLKKDSEEFLERLLYRDDFIKMDSGLFYPVKSIQCVCISKIRSRNLHCMKEVWGD